MLGGPACFGGLYSPAECIGYFLSKFAVAQHIIALGSISNFIYHIFAYI
jgi:hypothetical protein